MVQSIVRLKKKNNNPILSMFIILKTDYFLSESGISATEEQGRHYKN